MVKNYSIVIHIARFPFKWCKDGGLYALKCILRTTPSKIQRIFDTPPEEGNYIESPSG
jgi:hypothetical protein